MNIQKELAKGFYKFVPIKASDYISKGLRVRINTGTHKGCIGYTREWQDDNTLSVSIPLTVFNSGPVCNYDVTTLDWAHDGSCNI